MKVILATLFFLSASHAAFVPHVSTIHTLNRPRTILKGYLDDLSDDLYGDDPDPDLEKESKDFTDMSKDQIDRFGPGSYEDYVEFDEFDGGDGQMGVAGDGNKGLEKIGGDSTPSVYTKSKSMSAKNAWGTDTGYAEKLKSDGMDTQKAQRLENWQNQQEVRKRQIAQKAQIDQFETQQAAGDEDWRKLAAFGVERNQDFNLDSEFGAVVGGDAQEIVELSAQIGRVGVFEFSLKNDFMGFADFRAAFTSDSNTADWQIKPEEGSLSKNAEDFIVRFKPNNPGVSEATLVIDTEDMKKTWKFIGTTA